MTWLSVMAGDASRQFITGTKETGLGRNYYNNLVCNSQICVLWLGSVEQWQSSWSSSKKKLVGVSCIPSVIVQSSADWI